MPITPYMQYQRILEALITLRKVKNIYKLDYGVHVYYTDSKIL